MTWFSINDSLKIDSYPNKSRAYYVVNDHAALLLSEYFEFHGWWVVFRRIHADLSVDLFIPSLDWVIILGLGTDGWFRVIKNELDFWWGYVNDVRNDVRLAAT